MVLYLNYHFFDIFRKDKMHVQINMILSISEKNIELLYLYTKTLNSKFLYKL